MKQRSQRDHRRADGTARGNPLLPVRWPAWLLRRLRAFARHQHVGAGVVVRAAVVRYLKEKGVET
ncbi:MAG TPA: hypothetical protein VLV45_12160 [Gemmatimonadales bacterium]|nr:hypothetical protein [Gemmatimonadales bacterium]